MIGFVVAMDSEARAVLDQASVAEKTQKYGMDIYRITLCERPFVLIRSGVGKVNAAMATQYLIDVFDVEAVINYGVVGGVMGQVELGEVYLVDKCAQYDFDISEIDGCKVGVLPHRSTQFIPCGQYPEALRCAFETRSLATGDRFTADEKIVDFIRDNFGCGLRDMEGAAVAQVCERCGVHLMMLKGISDYVGAQSVNMYEKYASAALTKIGEKIKTLIELS